MTTNPLNSENLLLAFLSEFKEIDASQLSKIASLIPVECYEKGTVLIEEGSRVHHCYYVLKGCLRQYQLVDGIEKTTRLYVERQPVAFFNAYTQQSPVDVFVECAEDSVLIVGDVRSETTMYEEFPVLQQITRKMMEEDFGKMQESFAKFIISTPEQRYQDLLEKRPDLLQRIPQNQLASYIGVTPESLSHIRKRLGTR